jgi:GTP cyclohydrolase II
MPITKKLGHIGPIHLPLDWGTPDVKGLQLDLYERDGARYPTARLGEIDSEKPTLVRVQSACALADFFNSRWCDCAWQFAEAKRRIFHHGSGLIIYCYDQHGKGVGLRDHFRIYAEGQKLKQELLTETFDYLGLPYDNRRYDHVMDILREIGIGKMTLMTNDPERLKTFRAGGFEVERESLVAPLDEYNQVELAIKRNTFGHMID